MISIFYAMIRSRKYTARGKYFGILAQRFAGNNTNTEGLDIRAIYKVIMVMRMGGRRCGMRILGVGWNDHPFLGKYLTPSMPLKS
jgi:hypothetical protein